MPSSSNKKINIVMFNMSSFTEWERGLENRNYHILQNLLKDERVNKIIAVDYLPHTYKRVLRNYKENILGHLNHKLLHKNWHRKIYEVNEKLIVYSTILPKFSKTKFYQKLNKFLAEQNFEDFIVWSYYPLEVGYLEKIKARLFVFDAVDNWIEHPSYKNFRDIINKNYQVINEKADLIFLVSSQQKTLFSHGEKVHLFPNAVDLKHYQRDYAIINRDIGNLLKPIIGYIGTVQDRFDVDLFEFLLKNNPEKTFVIVGPIWYKKIKQRLSQFKNVHLLGRKPYEEVPMYIQQFDVGIIPHKIDAFSKFTNPMKIYEYLACAKPVVTTAMTDLAEFKEVISIANDYQAFDDSLNNILQQKDDDALKEKRKEIIEDHSWLKRIDKMLDLIIQKL
ncbi:glycosyltransferase [Patescibacteria group bacterium]|nr:glycosyltransferase [Patescibacteria group bacterium]